VFHEQAGLSPSGVRVTLPQFLSGTQDSSLSEYPAWSGYRVLPSVDNAWKARPLLSVIRVEPLVGAAPTRSHYKSELSAENREAEPLADAASARGRYQRSRRADGQWRGGDGGSRALKSCVQGSSASSCTPPWTDGESNSNFYLAEVVSSQLDDQPVVEVPGTAPGLAQCE
jgi:hypothetical protein